MSIVLVGGAIAVGAILLALATRSRASQGPLPARAVFQLQVLRSAYARAATGRSADQARARAKRRVRRI